ncbi:MAG: O-antigen ligase family protein [Acidobacteriota bacterium]|nr:O-antigen ligase family protein [Acidobacteriota bacterium]
MRFERTAVVVLSATLVFSVLSVFVSGLWPIGAAETISFLLALAFVLRAAIQGRIPKGHWLIAPFAGALLWGLLQLLFNRSVYRFGTWSSMLRFAAYFSLFFATLQIFGFRKIRESFRLGAIYFGCLLAGEAIIQRFTSGGKIFWMLSTENTARAMGPFVNPDHYCAFIELIFPLALWQAVANRARTVRFTVIAAVMFASVITGASRAGFGLVVAELIFVLIFTRRTGSGVRQKVSLQVIAGTVSLILIFGSVVGWGVLLDRFQEPEQFKIRWQLWQSSWRMLMNRPWMGFGLGTWETVYPAYAIFDPGARADHAHNDWIEWADEGGLPFAGMLLVIAGTSLRLAVRYPWGVGVAAVFLHSFVDFPLQEPAIVFFLFTIFAAMVQESRQDNA